MRKLGITLLFGAFMGALLYASAIALLDWYQTGRLALHKASPLGGLDFITYASDPIEFTLEFDLYLFLFTAGAFGVLMSCREILLDAFGPRDLLDSHSLVGPRRTWRIVMLCYSAIAGALLIVAAINKAT